MTVEVRYWNGSGWTLVATNRVIDYFELDRPGQVYLSWQPSDVTTWQKGGVTNGSDGYFVLITIAREGTTSRGVQPVQFLPMDTPVMPFADVLPAGGDLPAKMMWKIASLVPWEYMAATAGTYELPESPVHMNSVIVASERIPLMDAELHSVNPGIGFYGMTPWDAHYLQPSYETGYEAYSSTTDNDTPLGHHTELLAGYLPAANTYYPVAWLSVPARPGVYRAFIRYRLAATRVGRMSLRISTRPGFVDDVYSQAKSISSVYGIDLAETLNTQSECLADLGSISISPSGIRSSIIDPTLVWKRPYSEALDPQFNTNIPIAIEAMKDAAATSLTTTVSLFDLILLPVNEHYTVLEGGRGPLARNGQRPAQGNRTTLVDTQLDTMIEEMLYINSLSPGRTTAYLGHSADIDPINGSPYKVRDVPASFSVMGAPQMVTDSRFARRFWFLWYKRVGNGVIWSHLDYKTRVSPFIAKQYVTLPRGSR